MKTKLKSFGEEKKISGSIKGTVLDAIQFFASQDVIVVVKGDLLEKTVMGDFNEIPASLAIRSLAMQLEDKQSVIRRSPNVYLIGEATHDDMIVRVFHVPGESADDYKAAFSALLSPQAKVAVVHDTIVIKDVPSGIENVDLLFSSITSARGQYLVEIKFVEVNRLWAKSYGLKFENLGKLDLNAVIGGGVESSTAIAKLQLSALLDANETQSGASLVTTQRIHCIEGLESEMQVGQTVPIAKKSVSDNGTVTTTDFEYIDTGMLLKVSVRSEADGNLRVNVKPEQSSIVGYIEGAPIRARRRLDTTAVIQAGGVVVVGGFDSSTESEELSSITQTHKSNKSDARKLFIVLRVIDTNNENTK